MGNWGYQPKDGDSASDMVYTYLESQIAVTLKALWRTNGQREIRGEVWDRLGFLQHVLERDIAVPRSIVQHALEDVEWLQEQKMWQLGWKSPSMIAESLGHLHDAFTKMLAWRYPALKTLRKKKGKTVTVRSRAGGKEAEPVGLWALKRRTLYPPEASEDVARRKGLLKPKLTAVDRVVYPIARMLILEGKRKPVLGLTVSKIVKDLPATRKRQWKGKGKDPLKTSGATVSKVLDFLEEFGFVVRRKVRQTGKNSGVVVYWINESEEKTPVQYSLYK